MTNICSQIRINGLLEFLKERLDQRIRPKDDLGGANAADTSRPVDELHKKKTHVSTNRNNKRGLIINKHMTSNKNR